MTKQLPTKSVILYADDDIDDIQLVKEAFLQYSTNVELITVFNGLDALTYLKDLPSHDPAPCLIILDINMPRMDGKEALVKLRGMKRFQEVPAILFTTSSQTSDKKFAESYNAGFFTKPIDYSQMDVIVNNFMDHCLDGVRKNNQSFN